MVSFSSEHTYSRGKVIFMKRTNWYDEFDEVITLKGTKDMLTKFQTLRELHPDEPFVWADDSPSRFTYILDENTSLVQRASPHKSDVALLRGAELHKDKPLRELLEIGETLGSSRTKLKNGHPFHKTEWPR